MKPLGNFRFQDHLKSSQTTSAGSSDVDDQLNVEISVAHRLEIGASKVLELIVLPKRPLVQGCPFLPPHIHPCRL